MQDFDRTGPGAFFNNPDVKAFYVKRMEAHVKADELIRGEGWDGHNGCAVGCTLDSYNHSQYPVQLNLPEWLAHLEDTLHENISEGWDTPFALQFLRAIPVGADVEPVRHHLGVFIMDRNIERVKSLNIDSKRKAGVYNAIAEVRSLHSEALSGEVSEKRWSAAKSACSAVWLAGPAAWSEESAVWSAGPAVESAARSACSAVWSAAESAARSACSAVWSAAESAFTAEYDAMAHELIRLLKEANSA